MSAVTYSPALKPENVGRRAIFTPDEDYTTLTQDVVWLIKYEPEYFRPWKVAYAGAPDLWFRAHEDELELL